MRDQGMRQLTEEQRHAAEVLARHPDLHIRDYMHRPSGERYEIWNGDQWISSWCSPPDAEVGIREYLGLPVPDFLRRVQAMWNLQHGRPA